MQNIQIIKKECPFCFQEIANDEAAFLLKGEGYRFISPVLNEVVAAREDVPYLYFWNAMGIPEEQVDAKRTVIDNPTIYQLNQELAAAGREMAQKMYDADSCGFSFQVREGAMAVYSNTMVCPHCHNVLPKNFYKYDMLKIGLAGSIASGKTVYLSSLLMNSLEVMQRENLTVRNISNQWDASYKEMEEMADRLWRYGICPEPTRKTFRKPVFLEVSYHLEGRTKSLITAIYDVAGELFREPAGSGRTGFIRYVDGFICLVDPAQMQLSHGMITGQSPDEERVLAKLHIMSREEQINFQRMNAANGKQLMDFNDFMVSDNLSDNFIFERKAEGVLDNIRDALGNQNLQKKYMALTLAKSDLLESLAEIRSYPGSELLFEREQVQYGFLNTDHHFLRQFVLEQVFDEKVYRLHKSLDHYKESSLFAVSALGCETEMTQDFHGKVEKTVGKVNPIRVEEPVIWMIMKYMQERGWLI